MTRSRTALIVGAGIGGLAAGIALRRAGWDAQIFERAANPREHPRPLRVRAEIEKRRPAHRPDQHEVRATMRAQRAEDAARRAHAQDHVRPGRQYGGIGEPFQTDNEDRSARGGGGGGDTARQGAAAGQNPQNAR